MNSLKRLLLLVFLLTGFPACATAPISPENAQAVPSDRIAQNDLLVPEGTRTIPVIITRDTGFLGGGELHLLKIDGNTIAKFARGETLTIYLEKGIYSFGVINEQTIAYDIIGEAPIKEETDVTIKEGTKYNFRILASKETDFRPIITRTGL
jgi:hypothetical protein